MNLPRPSVEMMPVQRGPRPIDVMSKEFKYATNQGWQMVPAEVHGYWWIIFPLNWEDLFDDAHRT